VKVSVVRGPARGLRFKLDLLRGGENAYWLGRYEAAVVRILAGVCKAGWTVWDVGACIGFYSAFFARLVGPSGRVVSFEPHPSNLERTKANVELNRFRNVTFMNVAIGGPLGRVDLVVCGDTTAHLPGAYVGATRTAAAAGEARHVSVRCVSPDEVLDQYKVPLPDLIKMDIEGAEVDALRHFNRLAERTRPVILLELHNPECDAEAWRFARRFGYSITATTTGRVIENCADVTGTVLLVPNP
jgi:FkbM family methyltransferase